MTNEIVIVGGGLAAARTVRSYREAGGEAPITLFSADTHPPYNRPPLSKGFLRGEIDDEAIYVEPRAAYAELDVDLQLGVTVAQVDTAEHRVVLPDGRSTGYGTLVLASGSLPRALGIPGEQLDGVHTFRTLDDARAVRAAAETAGHALVVGAGFIGMETAASLRARGLEVTLVEPADALFGALKAPPFSRMLERLYRERGITVILEDSVEAFHGRNGRLDHAITHKGLRIPARLAVVGVGVEPATRYLNGSDVALERGSVLVDDRFQTTNPDVYAVGDLANFHDSVFGHRRLIQHWTNANHHGERLGRILAGEDAPYDLVAYFFSELFGTKFGLLGDLDAGYDELIMRGSLDEGGLIGFYLRDSRLVAALVSGQTPDTQTELTQLLRDRAKLHDRAELSRSAEARVLDAFRPKSGSARTG